MQKKDFEIKSLLHEKERLAAEVEQLIRLKDKMKDTGMLEDRLHNFKNEINTLQEKIINLERLNMERELEIANLKRDQPNRYSTDDIQSG